MAQVELEVHDSEAGTELIRGVRIKNLKDKTVGVVGEVAHFHKAEDETKEWEQACLFIKHVVHDPAGLRINDTVFHGEVIVPQCVSDYLASMDSNLVTAEANIFRGKSREKFVREING